jgi:FAD/FMN-containing dehydrogenase
MTIRTAIRDFAGDIILPGDAAYDGHREVWNAMVDRRPAVIARCTSADDVAAAIRHGRDAGLEIGVKCGGHNVLGLSVPDGGLMIDLSPMGEVRVDPARRRAMVQGGSLLRTLDRSTEPHGLATTAGNVSHTGVGGLTLGGGMGWLARQFGLACDNVESYTVVTADGETVRATATRNSDLFWGLRGGGGNFGVVTNFEFQLHPVKDIYAGLFFYELDYATDLLRFFREFIKTAPEEYGAFPAFQIAPPLPFVPPERVGDTFCVAIVHYSGPIEAGERAMEPFRAIAPIVAEMAGPMPYPALNSAFDAIFPKGIRSYWKGSFVNELSDEAIEQHVKHGSQVPEVSATMHLYPINGACHRVGADDTAFAYRSATFAPVILAAWQDKGLDDDRIAWVRDYYRSTEPYSEPGGYINFMADDDWERIQDNYRGHYDRLAQVKRSYDPGNLFHLNQNIKPAT